MATEKGIISFDFDSTLTTPHFDGDMWHSSKPGEEGEPNWENIDLLKGYVKQGYEIVIVTSRKPMYKQEVENFVKKYDLPVSRIIATGGVKGPTLKEIGALIHYDDMVQQHEDPNFDFKGKWVKIYHPFDGF